MIRQIQSLTTSQGKTEVSNPFPSDIMSEAELARVEVISPFRRDAVAPSQMATQLSFGAVDATAPKNFIAPYAGTVAGLTVNGSATLTSGSVTVQFAKNSVGVTSTQVVLTPTGTLAPNVNALTFTFGVQSTPVSFAAGDLLGVQIMSGNTLVPSGVNIQAGLAVRWAL